MTSCKGRVGGAQEAHSNPLQRFCCKGGRWPSPLNTVRTRIPLKYNLKRDNRENMLIPPLDLLPALQGKVLLTSTVNITTGKRPWGPKQSCIRESVNMWRLEIHIHVTLKACQFYYAVKMTSFFGAGLLVPLNFGTSLWKKGSDLLQRIWRLLD